MARAIIRRKHIMVAREAARKESNARATGKSVYIKRYYKRYFILGVHVTKKQRVCRDIFADAQKLASFELKQWNKKRHWARVAKLHKVKGAHRMAVSYFYKLLKENGLNLEEALNLNRISKYTNERRKEQSISIDSEWEKRENEASPFFYKKFRKIEEYYEEVMRLAA